MFAVSFRIRILAGLAFALFLWGGFHPGWGWLAWLSPALFFLALDKVGIKRGLILGGAFGLFFFALELSPIYALWPFLGGLTILSWIALSLYGAVFFAVLGGVAGWRSSPLLWAGAWVLLEAVRGAGPLGFSFGALPAALVGGPFTPAAAWGGAVLLSLAVAWTGACLARAVRGPRFLLLAALGPGLLALLSALAPLPPPTGELSVALVQPNIPQAEKLDRERLPQLTVRYESLLSSLSGPLDLVVLPENVLPAYLRSEPEYLAPFKKTAQRLSCHVLLGTGELRAGKVYNSVLLLDPTGEAAGVYDMVHLVPFGEYVPGRKLWETLGLSPLLSRLLPFDLTPGEGARPLGPFGAMICFESQFPGLARELTLKGAKVLIALTNDAWFGKTRFPWEHFAMGALRAAECGRAFLQAAQTGITGAFAPNGRFVTALPPWEEGVLRLQIPLYQGKTPFVRYGPWPVLSLAVLLVLLGLIRKSGPAARGGGAGRERLPKDV